MVTVKSPTGIFVIYKDSAEYRIIENGVVGQAIVPSLQDIRDLLKSLSSDVAGQTLLHPYIIANSNGYMYYVPSMKWSFTVRETLNAGSEFISYPEVLLPAMIFSLKGTQLRVLAVLDSREKLSERTVLYEVPLLNFYSDGTLCFGAANKFDSQAFTTIQAYPLIIEAIFGVPFTQEAHNSYLYTSLIQMYKSENPVWKKFLRRHGELRQLL